MSKKRKRRKHRKPDPAGLLDSLASALNRCEKAGLHPDLTHGVVLTSAGYVLPIKDRWAARPLKNRK